MEPGIHFDSTRGWFYHEHLDGDQRNQSNQEVDLLIQGKKVVTGDGTFIISIGGRGQVSGDTYGGVKSESHQECYATDLLLKKVGEEIS